MSFHLIIPAAGSGSRFGGDVPKQFVAYKGSPLISHGIRAFLTVNPLSITVAVSKEYEQFAKDLFIKEGLSDIKIVIGGDTRADSVKNAVLTLDDEHPILIHDAARPFVNEALIQRVIDGLATEATVIPGIACTDTIKVVKQNKVSQSLVRDELRRIQTPQGFQAAVLRQAYESVQSFDGISDEAGLVEAIGVSPLVVEGDEANIKVTLRGDL